MPPQAWSTTGGPVHDITVYRGLRVRFGIHSGLDDASCVAFNKSSRRMQYSGAFASTAKYVGDAAHGGQVGEGLAPFLCGILPSL
jgi:hypothetical protein